MPKNIAYTYYPIKKKLLAHLLEHLLTIHILNQNLPKMEIGESSVGGGYIWIEINSQKADQARSYKQINDLFLPQNTALHWSELVGLITPEAIRNERDVILSELIENMHSSPVEVIYQQAELDLSSTNDYHQLLDLFQKLTPQELQQSLLEFVAGLEWGVAEEGKCSNELTQNIQNYQKKYWVKPSLKIGELKLGNNDISEYAQLIICNSPDELKRLQANHQQICLELSRGSRKTGIYHFHDALYHLWGNRLLCYYGGYVIPERCTEFSNFVKNLLRAMPLEDDIWMDNEDGAKTTAMSKDLIIRDLLDWG